MLKSTIKLFIALALGSQIAACSSLTANENITASNEGTSVSLHSPTPDEPSEDSISNESTPQPSSSLAVEPEQQAQPVKLYRMNDAYRFEPMEESTPAKAVLLTFDDGPKDEGVITSMLDTLDNHQAKAIFFVNGYRVKQNPDLLKLIYIRGQTIGNHSWDHINLKNESEEVIEQQLADLQAQIESFIGEKPIFFRPPYGSGGDKVKNIAKNHGMLYMTWSNGSLDWDKSAKNKPEIVIQNVMEQLHPGANILMHEVQWTADALDELLTKLENEGYSFIDPDTIVTSH
ncbi:polysaccharide deacetylase family protein [Paenibacillus sp. sgz302251]|uniref:polysaccharide deacetylase family protein n=1 Tax=Paenibacillus sp. sgz302251 TaxID=3414493 RepID=UPI003C7D749B